MDIISLIQPYNKSFIIKEDIITLSRFNGSNGNSSLSHFSLSFRSRERDLLVRSFPKREDFELLTRFSLLSPL